MRKLTVGDMFCGAGGTSHGLVNSDFVEIAWAINHDPNCIEAHHKNHPYTLHFEEDIVSMDIARLSQVDLLWASLECTHFSQAKGGQSRDADSRMLARQMYRYINQTDPSFVVIENVKEFLSWGPLMEVEKNGKTIYKADPSQKGVHYEEWVETICAMGYTYEYSMINSADHGARTSRNRYFGVFVKSDKYKVCFPKPSHSKTGLDGLDKWLPCRDYINLNNEGNSIFGRKFNPDLPKNVRKPLADNTIKRIVAGIKKFCIEGDLLYDPHFIMKYYGNGDNTSPLTDPLHTITTKDRHVLVSLEKEHFVAEHFGTNRSVDQPMPTIMAYKDQKYMVTVEKANFISKSYTPTRPGNYQNSSIDNPLHVIPTANIHRIVTMEKAQFIQQYFNSGGNPGSQVQSLNNPLWTNTTVPKGGLVTVNKTMNYLIDVKTRFLTADELKQIQGFSANYQLIGSQAVQKKAIGNSVVPLVAQKIIEELYLQNHQMI
jgi:DNA (cytosine-5)-methyltransferase 1